VPDSAETDWQKVRCRCLLPPYQIERNAPEVEVELDMSTFVCGLQWVRYAIQCLQDDWRVANLGCQHLWPGHEALCGLCLFCLRYFRTLPGGVRPSPKYFSLR
jgi:hypothetical protein